MYNQLSIQQLFCQIVLVLYLILNGGCSATVPNDPARDDHRPVIIALGVDLSGTFESYRPITTEQIKTLALTIANNGRQGMIAFSPIGNPSDSNFIRCKIQSLPEVDDKAVLSERAQQRKRREDIQQKNLENIDAFLIRYEKSISNKNQDNTDINGFAAKAKKLLLEPHFEGFQKILIIYSDGFSDVYGKTDLRCSFKEVPSLSFSPIGWKNDKQCLAINTTTFESFEGFVDFFTTQ